MTSLLPVHVNEKSNQPSVIASITRGALKITQASGLALGGVGLMMLGLGGAYVTGTKIKEFFLDKIEDPVQENYSGYSGFPGFMQGCQWLCDTAHENFNWPPKDTKFCESMANKPFSHQEGAFAAASLVASMGLSSICFLGSLYSFLGGVSLVGRSIEVFTSIL